ncbi:cyclic nucleotide-gated channel alpha-4 [Phaenicophaeus curvirostris]|uniref:cyclic nucleotide-gated channel alpha-4 n=1 Tax=Phaenicophaeus curvirostris TaxID=33595 RepID=UPI0037F0D3D4
MPQYNQCSQCPQCSQPSLPWVPRLPGCVAVSACREPRDREGGSHRDRGRDRVPGSGSAPQIQDPGSGIRGRIGIRGWGSGPSIGCRIGIGCWDQDRVQDWDQVLGSGATTRIGVQEPESGSGSGIRNQSWDQDPGSGIGNQSWDQDPGSGIENQSRHQDWGSGTRVGSRTGNQSRDQYREPESGSGSGIGNQSGSGTRVGIRIGDREPELGPGSRIRDWEPESGSGTGIRDQEPGSGIGNQNQDQDPGSGIRNQEPELGPGSRIGDQEPEPGSGLGTGIQLGCQVQGRGSGSGLGAGIGIWDPGSVRAQAAVPVQDARAALPPLPHLAPWIHQRLQGEQRGCLRPGRWVLEAGGTWHARWLALAALPVIYNCFSITTRAAFPGLRQLGGLWVALDALSDAVYVADIGVRMHTGFEESGLPVHSLRRVRRRYLCSWWFWWDAASVLPVQLAAPGSPAARANRCLRAARLPEAFARWETRAPRPNALRAARLLLCGFGAIHGLACAYFGLSRRLGPGADPWLCPNGTDFARPRRQYLHSLYLATLVLTTVGDTPPPQRNEEFLFLTAGYLLAVLGFATITGSISTVISNINAADAAFYPDPEPVRRYLRSQGVCGRLARRVASWHQHLRAQRKLPAERSVLRHLPPALRAEVLAGVHLPALRRVGLFRDWEPGVLRQLVLRLRPQLFGPGELVCRRGDVGREMYFIREGRLAVVADDGVTRLAVLGPGLYFGEISLINIKGNPFGNRRTATIVSLGHSDLFCLAKEDLAEVLAHFPGARAAVEAKGRQLLLRSGRLDLGAEAAAAEREQRARALGEQLEGLRERAARVVAQLEASALKMSLRLQSLEQRLRTPRGKHRGHPGMRGAGMRGAGGQGRPKVQDPSGMQDAGMQGLPKARGPPGMQDAGGQDAGGQGPPKVQDPSGIGGAGMQSAGVQDLPKAQGPPRMRDAGIQDAGIQGHPKMQDPSGIRDAGMQGLPKARGPPRMRDAGVRGAGMQDARLQGHPKMQDPSGMRGAGMQDAGIRGPPKAQGPPRIQGAGMQGAGMQDAGIRGPPKAQGPPDMRDAGMQHTGMQGPSGKRGAGGADPPH